MNQRMLTSVVPKQKGINDALVSALIGNVTSCIEILNNGITERELIRSKSQAVCTMLQEQREVMVSYLNHRFGERNKLYDGYFTLIDKAMESGNDDVTRLALESLLQIYSAPFASGIDDILSQYGKINSVLGD